MRGEKIRYTREQVSLIQLSQSGTEKSSSVNSHGPSQVTAIERQMQALCTTKSNG